MVPHWPTIIRYWVQREARLDLVHCSSTNQWNLDGIIQMCDWGSVHSTGVRFYRKTGSPKMSQWSSTTSLYSFVLVVEACVSYGFWFWNSTLSKGKFIQLILTIIEVLLSKEKPWAVHHINEVLIEYSVGMTHRKWDVQIRNTVFLRIRGKVFARLLNHNKPLFVSRILFTDAQSKHGVSHKLVFGTFVHAEN